MTISASAQTSRALRTRVARRLTAVMSAVMFAVGLAAAGAPHALAIATSQVGCTLVPTPGTTLHQVAGRTYYLHVPAGLSGPSAPLLLGLHGAGQPPLLHERNTGWSDVAAAQHFIVAYPTAQQLVWDAAHGSGDVTYLRAVVQDISRTWCVNPRQIYAEGHSAGAVMAARLACDAPTVFASVAGYGGGDPTLTRTPCLPERPIAVGLFQGNADPISTLPSAIQHRGNWLQRNGCPSTPTTEPGVVVEASTYAPCRAGVEVVWRVYQGGHFWPSGADHTDITQRMWGFFQRNPLPATAGR